MNSHLAKILAPVVLAASMTGAQEAPTKPQPKTPQRTSEEATAATETFSVAIVERLLSSLRSSLEDENRAQTLALIDRERMPDYSEFADNVGLIFDRYDPIRVQYRVVQTVVDADKYVAMVEFTLERTLASDTQPPLRRTEQLRFTFGMSSKKWKITDVQPRDIFAPFWTIRPEFPR